MIRMLHIGDVIGEPGREAVAILLPRLRRELELDFVTAQGENCAGGFGITPRVAEQLFAAGVDAITLGNHAWDKKEGMELIEFDARIIRPANYPTDVPGHGWRVYSSKGGAPVGVLNLMGRVYMPNLDDPFRAASAAVEEIHKETKVILVDLHAEVTSEKQAMGWYLDGKVSAVIGTHTHVQTADERILPGGTAYHTDAGMTGPRDSIIGMKKEAGLKRFLTGIPIRFEVASGDVVLNATFVEVDETTGRAVRIERVHRPLA